MKKLMLYLSAGLMLLFASCGNKEQTANTTEEQQPVAKVDTMMMSKDTLYNRLMTDVRDEMEQRRMGMSEEALSVIGETQQIAVAIEKNNIDQAKAKASELIGKLEILLAQNPQLAFLPVDASYRINEAVVDVETARKITKEAKKAMDKGYYQAAADLLSGLKSEVIISTAYIPLATYPDGIKLAAVLLDQGKTQDALAVIQQVLNTVVVKQTVLPLPVLKAEQLIIEAANMAAGDDFDKEKAMNLLDNADYQLTLAEELGYGKRDAEYKDLHKAIKEIKKAIRKDNDTKAQFDSLKVEIKNFKNRLFPIKNEK